MSKHTPGAVRAAERIVSIVARTLACPTQKIAAVIDRETAAPKLLAALQQVVSLCDERPVGEDACDTGDRFSRIEIVAELAIAEATKEPDAGEGE